MAALVAPRIRQDKHGAARYWGSATWEIRKTVPSTTLLELAIESWRFQKLFARGLMKLEPGEVARFVNQHRYFNRRLADRLGDVGIRLVNIERQPYDTGAAVTALNLGDFGPDDPLVVAEMVEPIMNPASPRQARGSSRPVA